jgi:hypothetical protein
MLLRFPVSRKNCFIRLSPFVIFLCYIFLYFLYLIIFLNYRKVFLV